MLVALQQLWTHRDLLGALVSRELKSRYRRSVLGFVWSLIMPLWQVVIFTFVLKMILHVQDQNLWVKMLSAMIPWTFFSVSILSACAAVLRFRGVIKKVYFPRQMLPLSAVAANLVHLLLSLLMLLALFAVIPVAFSPMFLYLVVLIVGEVLLVAGISLVACCAHTYFQDVEFVLQNLFQVGMFITPVLYSADRLDTWPHIYKTLFMLNPMAVYCEGWRSLLIYKLPPDPMFLGIALGVSVAFFLVGLAVWQRYEWRFPEVI